MWTQIDSCCLTVVHALIGSNAHAWYAMVHLSFFLKKNYEINLLVNDALYLRQKVFAYISHESFLLLAMYGHFPSLS
jgi:hypothetical protein